MKNIWNGMKKRSLRVLTVTLLAAVLLSGVSVVVYAESVQSTGGQQIGSLAAADPAEAFFSAFPADARLSALLKTQDGYLVCDEGLGRIWKVTPNGLYTMTGSAAAGDGSYEKAVGYIDGEASCAEFSEPWAIVPYADGYAVSDTENHVIRYFDGESVYTLAGTGAEGQTDGSADSAAFGMPSGLAMGDNGVLYIADTQYGTVRTLSTDGTVTTLVENLIAPTGLAFADGTLYIAETGANRICTYRNGTLSVLAGLAQTDPDADDGDTEYLGGFRNGPADKALFCHPQGIACGENGALYVADTDNAAVRVIESGYVYTLYFMDNGQNSLIMPRSIVCAGDALYIADSDMNEILKLRSAPPAFTDIPETAWYAGAAAQAARDGIIVGTGDNHFSPDMLMNRAQAVEMVARIAFFHDGYEIIDGEGSFLDVPADTWYTASAAWAVDCGITYGVGDGKFAPERTITREEFFTLVYRFACLADPGISVTDEMYDAAESEFGDWDEVSDFARDAAAWTTYVDIVHGIPGGLIDPKGDIDRAQAVQLLVSFISSMDW